MRIFYFLLLFFLVYASNVYSAPIQSEFILAPGTSKLKEGDLVEGVLRFWPIENANLEQFKKLEKELLFDSFFLSQVLSLSVSANNADVVELQGLFIVTSSKTKLTYTFKYNDEAIEVKLGSVIIEELKDRSKDFYILDQSLDKTKFWIYLSIILTVLLLVAFFKRAALRRFIEKIKPDKLKKARKRYDKLFRSADKREEFERLYREREQWLPLLTVKAPAHTEFLKTLNAHQFKKDWGNVEYSEVRTSFDIIRRSFEK